MAETVCSVKISGSGSVPIPASPPTWPHLSSLSINTAAIVVQRNIYIKDAFQISLITSLSIQIHHAVYQNPLPIIQMERTFPYTGLLARYPSKNLLVLTFLYRLLVRGVEVSKLVIGQFNRWCK